MALWVLRMFFMLVCAGAGWQASRLVEFEDPVWGILGGLAMFTAVFAAEAFFKAKESVANLMSVIFGIAVGILFGNLAFYITMLILPLDVANNPQAVTAIRIILTVPMCYLMTMVIFRTRDRFRFVIPYVEFKRQSKGARALLLDTSAIIDGRIKEVAQTGVLECPLFIPDFVLEELQALADSADRLKRARGQRGLNLVNQLQRTKDADVSVYETEQKDKVPVDSRLIQLARELEVGLCTTDANLSRVARAQGVKVLNLNELATALRPSVARGDSLVIELVRRGEEPRQAVGFLDDGSMVVVENAEDHIGQTVAVQVTRYLQRTSGRIIFGRLAS